MEKAFTNMASSTNTLPFFAPLSELLEGTLTYDKELLTEGSTDSSSLSIQPQVIVYPKHSTDIRHIFTFAKEYRIPLSVRGNGKSTSGGSLTEGIQLDVSKHFTKIHKVDLKNNTATVDAGIRVDKLIARFTELGVRCPVLSFEIKDSTLGGLVAENSTTEASITHGDIRSWVQGVALVLDNGEEHKIEEQLTPTGRLLEIYENVHPLLRSYSGGLYASLNRTLSSTSGYNVWNQTIGLKQLLDIVVGSEGTLGVITTVTIRIVPLTKHVYTLCAGVSSLLEAQKIANLYKQYGCDTLSLTDTSLILDDYIPAGVSIPSFIKTLKSPYLLTGTFIAKDKDIVHRITHNCRDKIVLSTDEVSIEQGNTWAIYKDSLKKAVLEKYAEKKYSIITTFDSISLPHERYTPCADEICLILDDMRCEYILGGNIGSDQLSVIFLIDTTTHLGKELLDNTLSLITKIIQKNNGSVTGGNGDGIIRTPYIGITSDTEIRTLYKEIQKLFDPNQILNSGKKTFLPASYTTKHLKNQK